MMSLGRLLNGDGCVCVSVLFWITITLSPFDTYEGSVKSVQRAQMVGMRRTGGDFAPPPNFLFLFF